MKECMISGRYNCNADEDPQGACVCVPDGWEAAAWRALTPEQRREQYKGIWLDMVIGHTTAKDV